MCITWIFGYVSWQTMQQVSSKGMRKREKENDLCDSPATCCRRYVLTLQQQADKQWFSFLQQRTWIPLLMWHLMDG